MSLFYVFAGSRPSNAPAFSQLLSLYTEASSVEDAIQHWYDQCPVKQKSNIDLSTLRAINIMVDASDLEKYARSNLECPTWVETF